MSGSLEEEAAPDPVGCVKGSKSLWLAAGDDASFGFPFGKIPASLGALGVYAAGRGGIIQHGAVVTGMFSEPYPSHAVGSGFHVKGDAQRGGLLLKGPNLVGLEGEDNVPTAALRTTLGQADMTCLLIAQSWDEVRRHLVLPDQRTWRLG